jgi:hypothetical protein
VGREGAARTLFASYEDYLVGHSLLDSFRLPVSIVSDGFEASIFEIACYVPVCEEAEPFLIAEDVAAVWCFDDVG